VALRNGTNLRYIHQDNLGSTSVVTNSSGAQLGYRRYYPYGSTRDYLDPLDTDKKFTGQRLDGTGLYYYGARYYDPTIGRFISADTIVPNPVNPQALNRYSYCLNNPLKYIDPTGHDGEEAVAVIGVVPIIIMIPGVGWVIGGFVVFGVVAGGYVAYTTGFFSAVGQGIRDLTSIFSPSSYPLPSGWAWDTTKPMGHNTLEMVYVGQTTATLSPSESVKIGDGLNVNVSQAENDAPKTQGRSTSEKIKDIEEHPGNWEKVNERPDPQQPKNGSSDRELWRNKITGEELQKHVLERGGQAPEDHPHYQEPEGW